MGVLDEIKAISAQLGLGFGLSLAIYYSRTDSLTRSPTPFLEPPALHVMPGLKVVTKSN